MSNENIEHRRSQGPNGTISRTGSEVRSRD